ncbi:MAG TPA: thiamine pyrophosphate-dependent enzyme, partial [Thermoanaerobaculia bacterium]|nr:thiamine pyrophosphate-dependent enzyme [Thermoanaerobaculia bacterium]
MTTGLRTFLAERYPFALHALTESGELDAEKLRVALGDEETTPRVTASERLQQAIDEILAAAEGFRRREAITASLTPDEKRSILRGMLLTRATDNRLKQFFTGGEVRWGNASFQGKGFRSLGQEAIYAAVIRLQPDDVISPMIRDLGAVLAKHNTPETVRMVLSAQMGKAGPPMNGKDLHVGDWARGILPAMAPLGSPALTIAGIAMAFQLRKERRVAVSFVGEGTTSLGEWHEAINACAARKLPAVFCVQNNQTALSTPVRDNSAVRVFADKGPGYGIPSVTIDGTDPEAVAAAFTWAAERAREGHGPALIELVAMRMCGHAHHDDMLYLGKDPQASWTYPALTEQGYADRDTYEFWRQRDPIVTYAAKLEAAGIVAPDEVEGWKKEIEELVDAEARKVIDAPWPDGADAGTGVLADEPRRAHVEVLDEAWRQQASRNNTLPAIEEAPPFDAKGKTFLEAVMLGVGDVLRADERAFVYGEDVGGKYGNAFLLLRPLLKDFGDRIINAVLSEGATIGVCTGAALAGMRPIGEMQFNDFVASGFNALVNNAAKIRYRWGGGIPMVLRMPWGGLRYAGPYHSQNTEAWFYRTPGLKIVVPSTPYDARALMMSAANDPDPVLYYEHIALYRDPKIKQALTDDAPAPIPIGKAALRRAGDDLAIISYGAYVHDALQVAEALSKEGHECAVLD